MINVDSTIHAADSLPAQEAAALLGVKLTTLYAYASRGLVRRVGTGRARSYLKEDLQRLRTRHEARAGHTAVAAHALDFGEPVLDSAITFIDERGPHYRGELAVTLAMKGVSFEAVATLLWTSELPSGPLAWRPLRLRPKFREAALVDRLLLTLPELSQVVPERFVETERHERALAALVIRSFSTLFVDAQTRRHASRASPGSVAEDLAQAFAPARRRRLASKLIDVALVLSADHELNASSFAARIAASTDADLCACLMAALATISGPRHGGACDRVEALLDEAALLARPADVIQARARRGEQVPGFGHPLYPAGDPRARELLDRAREIAEIAPRAEAALRIAELMARRGSMPNLDFGLVTLSAALGLKPGVATLLFAMGRSAGWVAHVLEQRESPRILRPRARYVGR